MKTVEISEVQVVDRQRQEIGPKKLEDLKRSILSKGLLHAPVLSLGPEGFLRLRAGERRIRAMEALHAEGLIFQYDGQAVPENHIPYVEVSDLSSADLFELELEENLCRADLTWMEETEARAKLHKLRCSQNGPSHTYKETAKEVAKLSGLSTQREEAKVAQAHIVVAYKDDPRVKKAKSADEAFKAILDASEDRFKAKLALSENISPSVHQVIHGDCRKAFPSISPGSISTIICDPPYGIDAHQSGQESKHFYDDSAAYALEICEFILREGFKLCTPRATLFMFCDIDHFVHLRTYAAQQAWTVYRTPIIWNKQRGGRAPWGKAGFQRAYEIILFAVKGQDELLYPGGIDILDYPQDTAKDRSHAANKPTALLERLIQLSTLQGETVLDPCAGSGSIILAADKCHVKTICIEQDEIYYSQALSKLAKA